MKKIRLNIEVEVHNDVQPNDLIDAIQQTFPSHMNCELPNDLDLNINVVEEKNVNQMECEIYDI